VREQLHIDGVFEIPFPVLECTFKTPFPYGKENEEETHSLSHSLLHPARPVVPEFQRPNAAEAADEEPKDASVRRQRAAHHKEEGGVPEHSAAEPGPAGADPEVDKENPRADAPVLARRPQRSPLRQTRRGRNKESALSLAES